MLHGVADGQQPPVLLQTERLEVAADTHPAAVLCPPGGHPFIRSPGVPVPLRSLTQHGFICPVVSLALRAQSRTTGGWWHASLNPRVPPFLPPRPVSSTLTTSTSFPSSLTHGLTSSSTATLVPVPISARSLCDGQSYDSHPMWPPPAATCCHLSSQLFSQYRCVSQRPALHLPPTTRSFCPVPFGLSPTAAAPADRIFWVLSTPSCLPQCLNCTCWSDRKSVV